MGIGRWTGMLAAGAMVLVGCGGDDDADSAATTAGAAGASAGTAQDQASATTTAAAPTPANGGAGSLEVDGEAMVVESSRCYLEEQDAAAGGGKILFVGQVFGTTADGSEPVMLDVSRFDEDSMFAGDSISITIGELTSGSARSASAGAPTGTVTVDDAGMRATDVALLEDSTTTEILISFDFTC